MYEEKRPAPGRKQSYSNLVVSCMLLCCFATTDVRMLCLFCFRDCLEIGTGSWRDDQLEGGSSETDRPDGSNVKVGTGRRRHQRPDEVGSRVVVDPAEDSRGRGHPRVVSAPQLHAVASPIDSGQQGRRTLTLRLDIIL